MLKKPTIFKVKITLKKIKLYFSALCLALTLWRGLGLKYDCRQDRDVALGTMSSTTDSQ